MRLDAPVQRTGTLPEARRLPDWALVLLGAVVAAVLVLIFVRDPARVEAVTISNPTRYQLTVDAREADGAGVTRLGSIPRGGTATFRQVVDHGEEWVLSFSYAGRDAGEVTVSRSDLEQGWTVPDEIDRALRSDGFAPSATTPPPVDEDGEGTSSGAAGSPGG